MMEAFKPTNLDFNQSPITGMTRKSWLDAGKYLLRGVFENLKDAESPVVLPRQDYEITYPNKNTPAWKVQAEYFEGLTRTMFIAAPLIHEEPDLTINGIGLRDYYRRQILRAVTKGDPNYVRTYTDMQKECGGDPFAIYQQTVETCALVIDLELCHEEIWDTYSKEEQQTIADFLRDYADAATVPQNWRLFNMLDYAFLYKHGYEIDEDKMRDHAQTILNYYAGDGWYRDGHGFDYYSVWAFNTYTAFWNKWYGYEKEPWIAARYEENSNELMKSYADWFDRDGFTNMWGRSGIYRLAATSAFDGNLMMRNSILLSGSNVNAQSGDTSSIPGITAPVTEPSVHVISTSGAAASNTVASASKSCSLGLARRIMSGSLLQFFTRDDFLYEGVPTLGFYRQFLPLVQGYSCAESPYWMGKAFLCLALPADHPFWTATEEEGTWAELAAGETKETVLNGPALCMANHEANGETTLRTGKVICNAGDLHDIWNYAKLAYNTKYPWESCVYTTQDKNASGSDAEAAQDKNASGSILTGQAGDHSETTEKRQIESQQYVMRDLTTGTYTRANATLWNGYKDQVLYRRQFFDYKAQNEPCWLNALNLADFTVPCGLIRVDKLRNCRQPVEYTLGAYGFPDNGTEIIHKERDGFQAIILKGHDHTGREKQLAMTIFDGWTSLDYVRSQGTNPDSPESILVYAKTERKELYGYDKYVLISQVITKEDLTDFTDEELFPIRKIAYTDPQECGGYGPVTLTLTDGTTRTIDYYGIEGQLVM